MNPTTSKATGLHPLNRSRSKGASAVFLGVMIFTLAGDLISKSLAFKHVAGRPVVLNTSGRQEPGLVPPHDPVPVVPGVLSLKLTLNTGAIFGLGRGSRWLLIGLSLMAVVVILWLLPHARASGGWSQVALGLILAGALGNLYDRVRFGAVRDLLYLFPGVHLPWGLTWPGGITELYPWIFNIADAALVIGVGAMMIGAYRRKKPTMG